MVLNSSAAQDALMGVLVPPSDVRSREGKMNEWFKKRVETVKGQWGKWTPLQKGILVAIIAAVIVALVFMMRFSAKPATVRLFNSPVTDEVQRSAIVTRLDQDNIRSYVSQDGYISVDDEKIAKRYRSKLVAEGLEPNAKDPYSLFNTKNWSQSDFQNKVEWQHAQEKLLEEHLKQLDCISRANVRLVLPDDALFESEQAPTTASVVLFAKQGAELKPYIKGIQNLIARSVEGIKNDSEHITIIDGETGEEINNVDGMEEYNRMSNIERGQKIVRKFESEYSAAVLKSLQSIYTDDRVRIANMKVDLDLSEKQSEKKEYGGITIKPDNVNTPYDDSVIVEKLTISEETVDKAYTGTGYNPEGPAGVEGQNPPVYSDNSNMIGKSTESGVKRNYALNETHSTEKVLPNKPDRITVSVNIDGKWNYPLYDDDGKIRTTSSGGYEREYVPLSDEEKAEATRLVQNAVGYNASRGDSVTVTNIPYDRSEEFKEEDARFRAAQQRRTTILLVLIGIAVVLVAFILFRVISREIERRRRLRAEELLRKQQAEREQALWDAKEQGMEVTMSVEERKRAELQENAIAMAKEHPEDVAMLIRTWLMEE